MSIIVPANTLAADGGYDVDNSLRFGSNTYLTNTFGSSPTLATKNTISLWFKRSTLGTLQQLMSANNNAASIVINTNDTIAFYNNSGDVSGQLLGPRLYRDTSAWMHFVFATDTTQGTASNRLKVYINGVLETSFNNTGYPEQDVASALGTNGGDVKIGTRTQNDRIFEGYIAETAFVDGQALAADSFGEFDNSGNWRAIDISDLTFGNNGFYLESKAAGTGTNASGMGADTSGNTNHFAVNNLTAVDQSTDTCTNNFCTWNPLDTFYNTMTFQEGNTQGTKPNSTVESYGTSTFGITSGKWYAEFKVISFSGSNSTIGFGIIDRVAVQNDKEIGKHTYGISYKSNGDVFSADGNLLTNQGTLAANDIIGLYIDIDNLKFYFAKNGTIANSGTGLAIPALTSTLNGVYFFGFDNFQAGGSVHQANWGNPAYTGTDKADANGFGSFEYDPSSGTFDSASKDFLALCTKNLAEYGG